MGKIVLIEMLELGRNELQRTAAAVPDDKLKWKPLDNGRTVLDLLGDAAQAPRMAISVLEGNLQYGPEVFQRRAQERAAWTRDEAFKHLEANTLQLIAEIEKISDEKFDEPMTLAIGGGRTLPLGSWILMCYRSFMSRTAQINYIQTLYGDFDRH